MEQINVNFQLKGIELLEISIRHPQVLLEPGRTYNFNINIEQRINDEEQMVAVVTSIELIHEADKQCHASIKTSCIFRIENFQDFMTKDKVVEFPEPFIITLNSISLSTTRGIMFSRFSGTFMQDVLLPVVNPSALIKNNSVEK